MSKNPSTGGGQSPDLPPSSPVQSRLAAASLVCGIVPWGWHGLGGLACALAAIVTGHMAKAKIDGAGGALLGRGLANTGLVTGYSFCAIFLCSGIVYHISTPTIPFQIDFPGANRVNVKTLLLRIKSAESKFIGRGEQDMDGDGAYDYGTLKQLLESRYGLKLKVSPAPNSDEVTLYGYTFTILVTPSSEVVPGYKIQVAFQLPV